MEFIRNVGLLGQELALVVENVEDRMFNLNALGLAGLTANDCLPETARCDSNGNSSLAGFRAILLRAIQRSVSKVENKIKLSLYPKRRTNFARTAKEVYEDRIKYGSGGLDSFLTTSSREYPQWGDLSAFQQSQYNDDQSLYTPGTLPWDLLTFEQKTEFSREVIYVPNKSGPEERLDGRGRSYIKLYNRYVTKIHKLALEIQDPQGLGIPYLNRSYSPNEYFLYSREGGLTLFPAQAKISSTGPHNLLSSSGYGLIVPTMPQILAIDYTYGLDEVPYDLQDAVALYAATYAFEMINIAFTKGAMSFSVQGFSASFGKGLYSDLLERYRQEAEDLLAPYYQIALVGW